MLPSLSVFAVPTSLLFFVIIRSIPWLRIHANFRDKRWTRDMHQKILCSLLPLLQLVMMTTTMMMMQRKPKGFFTEKENEGRDEKKSSRMKRVENQQYYAILYWTLNPFSLLSPQPFPFIAMFESSALFSHFPLPQSLRNRENCVTLSFPFFEKRGEKRLQLDPREGEGRFLKIEGRIL